MLKPHGDDVEPEFIILDEAIPLDFGQDDRASVNLLENPIKIKLDKPQTTKYYRITIKEYKVGFDKDDQPDIKWNPQ